jgi:hypothetical protein
LQTFVAQHSQSSKEMNYITGSNLEGSSLPYQISSSSSTSSLADSQNDHKSIPRTQSIYIKQSGGESPSPATSLASSVSNKLLDEPCDSAMIEEYSDSSMIDDFDNSMVSQAARDMSMNIRVNRFFPESVVKILNKWFEENQDYPYPDDNMTNTLAKEANISAKQVRKWFANKRVRSNKCSKQVARRRKASRRHLKSIGEFDSMRATQDPNCMNYYDDLTRQPMCDSKMSKSNSISAWLSNSIPEPSGEEVFFNEEPESAFFQNPQLLNQQQNFLAPQQQPQSIFAQQSSNLINESNRAKLAQMLLCNMLANSSNQFNASNSINTSQPTATNNFLLQQYQNSLLMNQNVSNATNAPSSLNLPALTMLALYNPSLFLNLIQNQMHSQQQQPQAHQSNVTNLKTDFEASDLSIGHNLTNSTSNNEADEESFANDGNVDDSCVFATSNVPTKQSSKNKTKSRRIKSNSMMDESPCSNESDTRMLISSSLSSSPLSAFDDSRRSSLLKTKPDSPSTSLLSTSSSSSCTTDSNELNKQIMQQKMLQYIECQQKLHQFQQLQQLGSIHVQQQAVSSNVQTNDSPSRKNKINFGVISDLIN